MLHGQILSTCTTDLMFADDVIYVRIQEFLYHLSYLILPVFLVIFIRLCIQYRVANADILSNNLNFVLI